MATIPPHDPEAEHPATVIDPSSALQGEYEAAKTTYKEHEASVKSQRKDYEACYTEYQKLLAREKKHKDQVKSQHTTYQRHKRHIMSLSNDLLASNTRLRSASGPISDSEMLTHATLLHELRLASHTLMTMISHTKSLEKASDRFKKRGPERCAKVVGKFGAVLEDFRELQRLHEKVLEAGRKMDGIFRGCEITECLICRVNGKLEAAEKEAADKEGGSNWTQGENVGIEAKAKGWLKNLVEGGSLEDVADNGVD